MQTIAYIIISGSNLDECEPSGEHGDSAPQAAAGASRYPKRQNKADVSYSEIEMPDMDEFVCKYLQFVFFNLFFWLCCC